MIGFSKMAYDALAEGPNDRIPSDPKIMWKKSKLGVFMFHYRDSADIIKICYYGNMFHSSCNI